MRCTATYQMRYDRHNARSDERTSAVHVQALTTAQFVAMICGSARSAYGTAPIAMVMPVTYSGECRLIRWAAPSVYVVQHATEIITRRSPPSVAPPKDAARPTTK